MEQSHRIPVDTILTKYNTDLEKGLDEDQFLRSKELHGMNVLEQKGTKSIFKMIIDQLKEVMVIILILAAGVSFYISQSHGEEPWDAIVILIIVVLNTIIGFWQEYKAEQAMTALKEMTIPHVRVRRKGKEQEISAQDLVPGDIMLIESGDLVAADGRILEASNLKIQEAALTGESEAVDKNSDVIEKEDIALGDRKNMVYRGTIVTYGRATVLVSSIGMQTEIGKIAHLLQSVEDEKTPLQKRLSKLGTTLALIALGLVGIVVVISRLNGMEWHETFMTAISMAVAAIPEGLPAIVTISLALGAARLLKKKSLIRHLPAVETLGSVTYICSDKTGTLTQNRMTVIQLVTPGLTVDTKDLTKEKLNIDQKLLITSGALCNDSAIEDKNGELFIMGDPTEGSLVLCSRDLYIKKSELEASFKRVDELPFDSVRKRMSTVHEVQDKSSQQIQELLDNMKLKVKDKVVFTKGSTDGMIPLCTKVWIDGRIQTLNDSLKQEILAQNEDMATHGIRVLGMAFKVFKEGEKDYESDLVFLGMSAMIDPIRPEVKDAVAECRRAGIHPVMITGDHPLTALAIGKELGIAVNDKSLTGIDLNKLSLKELEKVVYEISIYARVSPEHKMKIIDALQAQGEVVAMTGDGVNDAPALKSADIGVAMGITGTDVSKEASDMVLVDDNFTTIVNAVSEGRKIYDNIRKFLKYILAGNLAEILVMLAAPLAGLGLPLLPIQILWINLVTDGLPAIALGYEGAEKNIMNRPPYPPDENIFARGVGRQIGWVGTLTAVVCVVIGFIAFQQWGGSAWQTMIFSTLTISQMGFAMSVRSNSKSFFTMNPFSNPQLLGSVMLTLILQIVLIYTPGMQKLFHTVALSPLQLGICFAGAILVILMVDLEKIFIRKKERSVVV